MRVAWFLALILGACALAPAQADPNTREDVLAVSRAFDDAQRRQSAGDIVRYLADDFRIIYSSGRVGDSDAFVAGFTSPTMRITELFVEEPFYVDLGRDAAVVGGIGVIRGTESGAPFEERFRFADTLAKRDGRWLVVYIQVTPLAQPAPAQE
jgi:hypothetical protein